MTDGLGTTVQAGGNMVRSGLSSEEEEHKGTGGVETSATDTAKTAQNKLSEGVGEVESKGAEVGGVAEKKGQEMQKDL